MTWFSINLKLKAVDRGPVGIAEALLIVDDYFARLKPHYEWGEEALAETWFGFQKGPTESVSFCIHAPDHISFSYEGRTPKRFIFWQVQTLIEQEQTLHSKDEVKAQVSAFYDLDSASFQRHVVA